jgi:phage shock protein C
MESTPTSLIARDDTLLGVCAAIAEDFGFNPVLLRLLFGIGMLFSPFAAIAAYAGAGALVAASRWLVPEPRSVPVTEAEESVAEAPAEPSLAWGDLPIAA